MSADPQRLDNGGLIAGHYRVQSLLGQGGAGNVYRVQDERDGRLLALKQLQARRSGAGSASLALFEREYHTLCQLAHPRIIEVYDYGIDAQGAFYTMELLDGSDLQTLGAQPWRRACALLSDVLSSLAIVHSRRLVHRDVSARNVRCTSDGRAKLIDFGAMGPMGIAKHIVGTPIYLAPEALELQALDGRADLYSLGALAYFVLSGYHAYHVRSVAVLRAAWRSPPLPPSEYAPDVPAALDRLVMELLSFERDARPSTAAEVMERLCGIAGLTMAELPQVKRSYLIMPSLVGRESPLQQVRDGLAAILQSGQGGSFSIEGNAGEGRSRMLDACILEARLLGMLVLRADASDSMEGGSYGVIRVLCEQLWQAEPELCEQAGQRRALILSEVLPALRELASHPPPEPDRVSTPPGRSTEATSRNKLLSALQEFLLAVARSKPLLIAIDDMDLIDEPSAALLGMLAHVARQRPLGVCATSKQGGEPSPAVALLRATAARTSLAPLDAEQTEALLRSIFGDVDHVAPLAARMQELAKGNPRSTMTLAEHLLECDLARYEAGSWSLPADLRPEQLPSSASAALLARFERLPPDAIELAEVLSLTAAEAIAPERYPALSTHGDHGRTYHALDALCAAGILVGLGDRYRIAHVDLARTLERRLSIDRKRLLHDRLSRALRGWIPRMRLAHHLLLGGHERSAIDEIRTMSAEGATIRMVNAAEELQLLLLQDALEAADRLELDLGTRLDLRLELLGAAAFLGERELFLTHATVLRERFELDSGLLDYRELASECDPAKRSGEALRRAEARYRATPPSERGFSLDRIERTVMVLHGATFAMSALSQDAGLIEALPRLEHLVASYPGCHFMQSATDLQADLQTGHVRRGITRAQALIESLERTANPDVRRFTEGLRNGLLYNMAQFAATSGHSAAGSLIAPLEQLPGHRVNAWRVRMVYELMHGNMDAAADCQRRAELLNLQDGGRPPLPGTTLRVELIAHMYAEDVMGVKRVMERIAPLAARYPGWRPTLAIARCHYRRLQGDAQGGLAELEPALGTQPGRHWDWWLIAYSHIKVLSDLERGDEAVACGERYLEIWNREQFSPVDFGLRQVTAEALARVGRLEEARRMIEEYIEIHVRAGTHGLRLALAYETAAIIARDQNDERAFNRYAMLHAREYKGGRKRLLNAGRERVVPARAAPVPSA
jgi:tRNA A-37 threonylcarbamoyl transferase component Bud32